MCGILGILSEDIDKNQVKRATNLMSHRGPDDFGFYFDEGIALGHRRLSIIDLSKKGHQPMPNEDGSIWIVFNGEIYNFYELRKILEKKHEFRSDSDTEVIIHSYEEWGEDCVEKFNGMFSFAIWDSNKKFVFLARDRAGIKPLYYYADNKNFIFASEIKAILEFNIKKELNKEILYDYFNYLIFIGNETFFKNILSFPAGYYGIITKKGIKLTKYWDSKYSYEEKNPDELKKILDQSVKRQMISDVPIGAFLSGGIDSSAIAALANNRSRDLKTFTAGFENYPEEIKAAEFVSNELGTKQYNILVKQEDFIKELPKLIWHYDGPISFASSVPLYFVSKLTKKKAKVVLTGEGSDELFAGYKRYYLIKRAIELNRLIGKVPFSRFISKFSENNLADPRYIKIIDLAVNGINYDFLTGINALIGKERDLLLKSNGNELFKSEVEKIFNEKKTNLINQLLYLDFKTYLVELLMKQDKMSMAASIESRVPFLDNKVIDFANKLPERSKLNGRIGKYILRESVKSILPESVIKRKKIGFSVPLNNWFKKDLNGYLKDELNNKLINRFFDTKYINKLIDKQKKSNCSLQLWALLNFNIWYKQNFENEQE